MAGAIYSTDRKDKATGATYLNSCEQLGSEQYKQESYRKRTKDILTPSSLYPSKEKQELLGPQKEYLKLTNVANRK